ncbi:plant UBX domain-containing protein 2 [Wolffia australiana]
MDDVKGKMKGILKKVNKTLSASTSTGKFQGQGRVLGSAAVEKERPVVSPLVERLSAPSDLRLTGGATKVDPKPKPSPSSHGRSEFSPWEPLISSGNRSASEILRPHASSQIQQPREASYVDEPAADIETRDFMAGRIGEFVSSEPPKDSIDVVLRLIKNVVREPDNDKFRKIRMGNPKIKQAVGEVNGATEVLESVGFRIEDDGGEIWAKMEVPEDRQIVLIKEAVNLLERWTMADSTPTPPLTDLDKQPAEEKMDRQVKVFFSVPESEAAKIELPDSFYSLSTMEIRREAEQRRKKIEESQLLVPRSFREKQMKASQKKYSATCIRIQFPDGVVLQGLFRPRETTTALYEFVGSSLKQPELEFELMRPALPRIRAIPRLSGSKGRPPTLEQEELVPSALIKFQPRETDSILFCGLANHLLEGITEERECKGTYLQLFLSGVPLHARKNTGTLMQNVIGSSRGNISTV